MDGAKLKTCAQQTIDAERADWSQLVAEVGDGVHRDCVTEQWSFKDLTGHLLGWRLHALDVLEAELRGSNEPPALWPNDLTTDDEINAWIYEQQHGRAAADVLAEMMSTFDRLRLLVDTTSERDLADPARFPSLEGLSLGDSIVNGDFFAHWHDEHEPEIRRWLATGSNGAQPGANSPGSAS
jgi:hypothetical protein